MTDNTTDTTLLVTVDSLRTDHVQFMPRTLAFLDDTHDAAFATSTATPGSFPAIIGGEYPAGNGLEPTASVTHEFDAHCVGITTNHLLSAEYDYATGFDSFTSPKGGGESLKEKGAIVLEHGSLPYKIASWGYNRYQQLRSYVDETEKSFRPADDVVDQFRSEIDGREEWFGWLHFMEPHHPYDPDGADIDRAKAQRITRHVLSDRGSG